MSAPSPAARTAAVYAAFLAGHEIGDYLVQRDADAVAKGRPGREGRAACARHCLSYTATQAAVLYGADRLLGLRLGLRRAAAGLALSGLSHYVVDRCAGHWSDTSSSAPALVRAVHAIGKGKWLTHDPGAPALLDQALHRGFIALAAAVTGAGRS